MSWLRFALMALIIALVSGIGYMGWKYRGALNSITALSADNDSLRNSNEVYDRVVVTTNKQMTKHFQALQNHEISAKILTDNYLKVISNENDPCLDAPAPASFVRVFMDSPID